MTLGRGEAVDVVCFDEDVGVEGIEGVTGKGEGDEMVATGLSYSTLASRLNLTHLAGLTPSEVEKRV